MNYDLIWVEFDFRPDTSDAARAAIVDDLKALHPFTSVAGVENAYFRVQPGAPCAVGVPAGCNVRRGAPGRKRTKGSTCKYFMVLFANKAHGECKADST